MRISIRGTAPQGLPIPAIPRILTNLFPYLRGRVTTHAKHTHILTQEYHTHRTTAPGPVIPHIPRSETLFVCVRERVSECVCTRRRVIESLCHRKLVCVMFTISVCVGTYTHTITACPRKRAQIFSSASAQARLLILAQQTFNEKTTLG